MNRVAGLNMTYVAKSILYPLFLFHFLKRVKVDTDEDVLSESSIKIVTALNLLFFLGASVLPGPLKLIGYFTFIPLLMVNQILINVNTKNCIENKHLPITTKEKAIVLIGGIITTIILFESTKALLN